MNIQQKETTRLIAVIGIIYFILFYFPNAVASSSIRLIEIFAIDEAIPLRYLFNMVEPTTSIKQFLLNFGLYEYYFYGYPYFAFSGLLMLPLILIGEIENLSIVMVILRQVISVLPMIFGVGLLVYLQTNFRSKWQSSVLFVFLLSIPGVVKNNLWWHPDSLSFLFATITFYFLWKDDFTYKKNFLWAAFFCGITVGIKLLGVFFILVIFIYIVLGFVRKKLRLMEALILAGKFLASMAIGLFFSNPTLIFSGIRDQYMQTLSKQSEKISLGFEIIYVSDFQAFVRLIEEYFSNFIFFLLSFVWLIIGVVIGPKKDFQKLNITFILTYGVYIFFFTAPKYTYLLPLAILLFSGLSVFLFYLEKYFVEGGKIKFNKILNFKGFFLVLFSLFFVYQLTSNFKVSKYIYEQRLHREANSNAIQFFYKVIEEFPLLLQSRNGIKVYKDIQMYFPDYNDILVFKEFQLLDLAYFQNLQPAVVFLQQTRISDYSSDYSFDNAIDPIQMESSYPFYLHAGKGEIPGYQLLYRDNFGLVFVLEDIDLLINGIYTD
jgi:hypothetical protein